MSKETMKAVNDIPVIDLSLTDETALVTEIAEACSTAGFFQVTNHGVSQELIQEYRECCRQYFTELPADVKERHRRNGTNARGYFDNELTKQRRDWKQALDVGVPGTRDWNVPDEDPHNSCLDGFNQLPTEDELPGFRDTVVKYFQACADLSHRLAVLMEAGMLQQDTQTIETDNAMVEDLRKNHTSYLRSNYYPMCPPEESAKEEKTGGSPPLGISPHRDAGFLTVLLQDDDCHSLQVLSAEERWHTVVPIRGALTINTGDMAQIWSNGRYKAPLHRVLTNTESVRYSAPFFYNPGYATYIKPIVAPSRYHPCLWGYFRAVRFAGDLTDLGVEIQIEDFKILNDEEKEERSSSSNKTTHLQKQEVFVEKARFDEPFSVESFRDLLVD
jgi:isopenicillin N synthase-like dioxygenase